MSELVGLDNREIAGVLGMNPSAESEAVTTIEKDMQDNSHAGKEPRRLFSIFGG